MGVKSYHLISSSGKFSSETRGKEAERILLSQLCSSDPVRIHLPVSEENTGGGYEATHI